jgi:osmotically-inducible protein OsmY
MATGKRLRTFAAALAVASASAGCAAITGQETAGEYVDDTTISARVQSGIVQDQALKGFRIGVETMQNVVQLSGFVDTPAAKERAERIARNVDGVRDVRNDIVVRTSG